MLPDGTKKMGFWEDGKRLKWLDGEENANISPDGWDNYKPPPLPATIIINKI